MNDINKFLVPGAVVLAGLFIAGAVYWNGAHPTGTTTTTGATTTVNIADVKTAGDPYYGNANAPVTIAYWSDYQCPFCKEFETTTLPEIVQNYVNSGQVKIVFKDFQFLGPDSMVDAEWARAVWALYPNDFFAWRTAMYTNQPEENSMSAASNLAYLQTTTASVSGINATDVEQNAQANQAAYDTAINADKTEAGTFGIQATPSFIIGTQLISGAYPYANFQTAIQAALK